MNNQEPRIRVGAIRWDAWAGPDIRKIVTKTLSPHKHRFRLPWYAAIDENDNVTIDGSDPAIMDQEIRYASGAGIDYWAFVEYGEEIELSIPLKQYLASPLRDQIQFCMILGVIGGMSPEDSWPRERDRLVRLLKEPTHVRVCGGRPLVYTYCVDADNEKLAARVADFRLAARASGVADPYLVFMGWEPVYDWNRVKPLGFDAVSAYAFGYMTHEGLSAPYATLVEKTEREQWGVFAANEIPSIPLIHSGWDKRPRMDNPVPWELNDSYHHDKRYIETATAPELAAHAARCVEWVRQHPDINPAQAAIIYAWNENDEGGWILPTRQSDGRPDTSRLDALAKVFKHVAH